MTQQEILLDMMSRGWVTPLDALREAGCLRLGARVFDLRADGCQIDEKWIAYKSRYGLKRIKAFRLKQVEKQGWFERLFKRKGLK